MDTKSLGRRNSLSGQGLDRTICERNRVDILKGYVGADHAHLLVSIPPSLAITKLM